MEFVQSQIDRLVDQLERLSPRERLLIVTTAVSVAAVIFYLLSLFIGSSLDSLRVENRSLASKLEEIYRLEPLYRQARAKIEEVKARLANNRVDLVRFLSDLSNRFNLLIQSMTPEKEESKDLDSSVREESVRIEMQAIPIGELAKFLDAIENSGKIVKVRRLKLRPNFTQPDKLDVIATISSFTLK